MPIRLSVTDSGRGRDHSETRDLSLGGLNFAWPKKIAKGTILDITIPVKEKFFELRGRVVFSREDRKSAHFHTGISFTDFPSAFKARLAEEVLQILEFRKTISRELGHEISEEEAASKWVRDFAPSFPTITDALVSS